MRKIIIKTVIGDNGLWWQERKKNEKNKKVGTWQVISEIYWYEKNNKNKWHMYLSKGVLN